MTGDLLSSASEALRLSSGGTDGDGGAGGAGGAGETLARVLHTVRRRKRTQRLARVVLVPVALLVMAAGAWAFSSGRLPPFWRGDRRPSSAGQGPRPLPARAGVAVAPTIEPLPSVSPAAPDSPPAVSPPAVRTNRALDRADDIYRQAHEAHFRRVDFHAALALWDRYLAITPLPRFSVEARFNRAIALARLGRLPEAAVGLRPFAGGDYGSYRRREALRLLDAIEAGTIERRPNYQRTP